jgi:PPP family 3-phenylpropionic acid transporter
MKLFAQASYASLQGLYWATYCAIYSFTSLFLLHEGLQNQWIGFILAGASILSVVLQNVVSPHVNTSKRLTTKNIFQGLVLLILIDLIVLLLLRQVLLVVLLTFFAANVFVLAIQSFLNSYSFELSANGLPVNFGFSRGIGSLIFAMTSFAIGQLAATFTAGIIPIVAVTLTVLFLICILLAPKVPVKLNTTRKKKKSFIDLLHHYHFLGYFIVGTICIWTFHTIVSSYMTQIMLHFGGNSHDIGFTLSLTALMEIPAMIAFTRLLKFKPASFWLRFAAYVYVVRGLFILLATSVLTVEITQLLQALSFAIFVPAAAYWLNETMETADKVLGQTNFVTGMIVGGVVGALAGGVLIDHFGIHVLLGFALLAAFCGAIATTLAIRNYHLQFD